MHQTINCVKCKYCCSLFQEGVRYNTAHSACYLSLESSQTLPHLDTFQFFYNSSVRQFRQTLIPVISSCWRSMLEAPVCIIFAPTKWTRRFSNGDSTTEANLTTMTGTFIITALFYIWNRMRRFFAFVDVPTLSVSGQSLFKLDSISKHLLFLTPEPNPCVVVPVINFKFFSK